MGEAVWEQKEQVGNIVSLCPSCKAPVWLKASVEQTAPVLHLRTIGIAPPDVTRKLIDEALVQNRMMKSVFGMGQTTPPVIITEEQNKNVVVDPGVKVLPLWVAGSGQ